MSAVSVVQLARDLKIPLVNDLMGAVLEGNPHPARFSFLMGKVFEEMFISKQNLWNKKGTGHWGEINISGGVAGGFHCSPNACLGSLRALDLYWGEGSKGATKWVNWEGNRQAAVLLSREWQGPSVRKGGVRREKHSCHKIPLISCSPAPETQKAFAWAHFLFRHLGLEKAWCSWAGLRFVSHPQWTLWIFIEIHLTSFVGVSNYFLSEGFLDDSRWSCLIMLWVFKMCLT